jgi:hypothetical protein
MRSLNAHGTYKSDWDSKTKLLYIVRRDYGIIDTIPAFSESDIPTVDANSKVYNYVS